MGRISEVCEALFELMRQDNLDRHEVIKDGYYRVYMNHSFYLLARLEMVGSKKLTAEQEWKMNPKKIMGMPVYVVHEKDHPNFSIVRENDITGGVSYE